MRYRCWVAVVGLLMVPAIQGCTSHRANSAPLSLKDAALKPGIYTAKWEIPKGLPAFYACLPHKDKLLRKLPDSVKAPRLVSKAPVFGYILFGAKETHSASGPIHYAVDESQRTKKGYDRLYFDANMNDDLTDDRPVERMKEENRPFTYEDPMFQSVAVLPLNKLMPGVDNPNPVALDLQFSIDRVGSLPVESSNVVRGCYGGDIDTDRGKLHFQLWDGDLNVRYDSKWPSPGGGNGCDFIVLGKNKSGPFGKEPDWYYSLQSVASVNSVNGRLYRLKPNPAGDALEVSKYTGPTGKLTLALGRIGETDTRLNSIDTRLNRDVPQVGGREGWFMLPTDGRPMDLPAGTYRLFGFAIKPVRVPPYWSIDYYHMRPVIINAGKSTTTSIDGKIVFAIEPTVKRLVLRRGVETGVSLRLVLRDGEIFRVTHPGPGAVPTFVLKDASGKTVYRGTTNFGDGAYGDFGTIPKDLKPGEYKAISTYDLGPFGGVLKAERMVAVK